MCRPAAITSCRWASQSIYLLLLILTFSCSCLVSCSLILSHCSFFPSPLSISVQMTNVCPSSHLLNRQSAVVSKNEKTWKRQEKARKGKNECEKERALGYDNASIPPCYNLLMHSSAYCFSGERLRRLSHKCVSIENGCLCQPVSSLHARCEQNVMSRPFF